MCRCRKSTQLIAQATAAGVNAEVAFTGLKGALARLASGEAAKALKGLGLKSMRERSQLMALLVR